MTPPVRALPVLRNLALACLCAGALVTAGCSSAGQDPGPSRAPAASASASSAPGSGQYLIDRGIRNGPRGFAIPADVVALRTIDQPNVVTLVVSTSDGRSLVTYLTDHQDALGLREVISREGSMTFRVEGWEGAVTTGTDIAGLTLRRLS